MPSTARTPRDRPRSRQRSARRAYDDFDRFLAHGLDLVIIGSPSGCHAEQAIAAARRGLHVLVEKPIDVTTARVDALLEEAGPRRRQARGVLSGSAAPGHQRHESVRRRRQRSARRCWRRAM